MSKGKGRVDHFNGEVERGFVFLISLLAVVIGDSRCSAPRAAVTFF